MTADIDRNRQARNVGWRLLNRDTQAGSGPAETLRADAERVNLIDQRAFDFEKFIKSSSFNAFRCNTLTAERMSLRLCTSPTVIFSVTLAAAVCPAN